MPSVTLEAKAKDLEETLVKQFRTVQKLLEITMKERANLLKEAGTAILTVVEEKEAVLDQLSLIEDNRRRLVQEIALDLNLHSEITSINELLPYLEPIGFLAVRRLSEGISTLVIQVRDLNYGNLALAQSRIDWMQSLQSFLVSVSLPEAGYLPPGTAKHPGEPAAFGVEYRA